MKPTNFKLLGIALLFLFGIQSETTYSQSQKEPYYDALAYRLLGPFEEEEALQLLVFLINQTYFILELLVGVYGKQLMEVENGKTFQMDILEVL